MTEHKVREGETVSEVEDGIFYRNLISFTDIRVGGRQTHDFRSVLLSN